MRHSPLRGISPRELLLSETRHLGNQMARLKWALLLIYVPLLLELLWLVLQDSVPMSELTRDPTAIGELPFYAGIVSNLGVLLWVVMVAVCWFTATLLSRVRHERSFIGFLFFSGLGALVLGLDDLFLIHENVAPDYLLIPEKALLAAYGLLALVYLGVFWRIILRTDYLLLLLAAAAFVVALGSEALLDAPLEDYPDWKYFFEDGWKLLGIVGLMLYFVSVCYQSAVRLITMEGKL